MTESFDQIVPALQAFDSYAFLLPGLTAGPIHCRLFEAPDSFVFELENSPGCD